MVRNFLKTISLLLLGLWLGAAVFFSVAVAPNVFGVLRGADLANASTLAGSIVTRLLSIINQGGFEIGLFVLIISFFATREQRPRRRWAEMLSLAIMAIMTGVGHWVVAARMAVLRADLQSSIDQFTPDARRIEFDRLHSYSVAMLSIAMITALLAFILRSLPDGKTTRESSR